MRTLSNLVRMGKPNLKVHLAKASTSEPASHVANSRKGKASLSQIMIKNKTACYKCGCYNHVAKEVLDPETSSGSLHEVRGLCTEWSEVWSTLHIASDVDGHFGPSSTWNGTKQHHDFTNHWGRTSECWWHDRGFLHGCVWRSHLDSSQLSHFSLNLHAVV